MPKSDTSGINMDRVAKWTEREKLNTYWRPYGFPQVMSADRSAFTSARQMPRWDVPEKAIVSTAINGAFFTKAENPAQPITA